MIYEPEEDSLLLLSCVKYARGRVLDMGTGSGIIAKSVKAEEIVAADINPNVLKLELPKHIKLVKSDLFENIEGRFDVIYFNPPYLPLDQREPLDSRSATTGGKKGHEILVRFIERVRDYLNDEGEVYIVFSSLTNKYIVDKTIIENMLVKEQLKTKKIPFETLYLYRIKKNSVFTELCNKGIKNIKYLSKGKRGYIYTGIENKKDIRVAIKISIDPKKKDVVLKEKEMLVKVNRLGIGPKLMFFSKEYIVMDFIEGISLEKYICTQKVEAVRKALIDVMEQCYKLDKAGITKEEMMRPHKNILIKNKPVMIDFEKSRSSIKPQNVTQFTSYLTSNGHMKTGTINLSKEYKKDYSYSVFKKIKENIQ